ncbi:bile acid:sodium symporter family protein [Oceanobacillus profundus]|uniref:Bile acid:sodium symporter family protein n=1 Tax=Oceanobacillus profundus TaxID=372463 RepID=A0A417YAY3_9BACI|nr:bile acid:sodium symporter family protein [Oceanobacillus profundus]MBR3119633.1 bile acid:sodium symporter family protein [Oceanobacillus sp.]MDO6451367.1 bile acid:sodium symporter family protein [Oceanobacillus profundus]PAE30732.1 sodium transporter [Paenibacillus sp. 7884-2]RHW29839.1 bile acid:sodium symporter family protein [Oceanobacillus profundus]
MKTLGKISNFATSTFALWVIIFAIFSYLYPAGFAWIAPRIPLLLGIIMFGMGLTLSVNDFKGIFKQPKSVLIGVVAQYTIMPLLAFGLAHLFQLPPEVAVGVILVGCCPGGTASNVMTFMAKGNTALSVTVTSVSTLLAPIMTPSLTFLLASQWLPVSFGDMFMSIVQVVLLPIVLGVIVRLLFSKQVDKSVSVLPLVSVIGIVAVAAAVVAVNKGSIAETGLLIFAVVVLHNCLGLLVGYVIAKLFKLNFKDQKAVSIEVGMQNSGLGAALALTHFAPIAAVPSAIFSVWHNISGPILATWWGKRSIEQSNKSEQTKEAG